MAVVLASLFIARSLVDPIVRLTGAMEEIVRKSSTGVCAEAQR